MKIDIVSDLMPLHAALSKLLALCDGRDEMKKLVAPLLEDTDTLMTRSMSMSGDAIRMTFGPSPRLLAIIAMVESEISAAGRLRFGDRCKPKDGGVVMTIVDVVDESTVVAAWGKIEKTFRVDEIVRA